MCLAIVKKSNLPNHHCFIGFIRDELFSKEWLDIGKHWPEYPGITGYKDLATGGSWLAFNDHIWACLINRENFNVDSLTTRAFLLLNIVENGISAENSLKKLKDQKLNTVRPFNMIIADRKNIFYATNVDNNCLIPQVKYTEITDSLTLINRSFPNDFAEVRVYQNFIKFQKTHQPDTLLESCDDWEELMLKECFAENPDQETTGWLTAVEWGSLTADIISIGRDPNSPFLIRHNKSRNLCH